MIRLVRFNLLGLGFVIGASAGIMVNSMIPFDPNMAVKVIIVTSIAGVACGAFIGRNK